MHNISCNSIKNFSRDPLGQFLLGGLAIFLVVSALSPEQDRNDNPKNIVIDRDVLLNQLQYHSKVFEPAMAERKLNSIPEADLENLITQYIHEEVLFREATTLGFGDKDYIIKKRMIQKMDFIIEGVSARAAQVTEADIQAYYDANASDFIEPGHITFTHVFINGEDQSIDEVEALANSTMVQLRSDNAGFTDAPKYGVRFPFGLNYVEKTHDLIDSHFGASMAKTVFRLTPDTANWQGPFRSDYGMHIVMITKRTGDRQQPLTEVRNLVTRKLENEKRLKERHKTIEKLVEGYTIERLSLNRPINPDEVNTAKTNSTVANSHEG